MGRAYVLLSVVIAAFVSGSARADSDWLEDLAPIDARDWDTRTAAHLMRRAGFGGSEAEVSALAAMAPSSAVRRLVYFEGAPLDNLPKFDHSGIFKEGLDPFPPSRPATTMLAETEGAALGIRVKASGNRPIQPVVNEFFYWLRASRLETDRVAYWWANRMLTSSRPLQEKTALFWHGHFATNEDKVRDYRKMLKQLELLQAQGLGNFRTLLIGIAQDPAMLAFLDAGVNVKGSPNENFAREIMELFTMGVGHYSEADIREAARAFTGWNYQGLEFRRSDEQHDDGIKTVLGERGRFDGVDVIDIILAQEVTSRFVASKLYRYFVRENLSEAFAHVLGERFRELDYDIAAYLELIFSSRDFYAPESMGSRIKGPVELVVATYRKLGQTSIPGVPDFNVTTQMLGQRLMHPPTVAGWSHGRSWITPSLLFERGNFVLDVVFPDIAFVPPDRYPSYGAQIVTVQSRLRDGMDITQATRPTGLGEPATQGEMAASNLLADRDENFNTRYGSYRGWQMAIERVKPIPRHTARLDLTSWVVQAELTTPREVVAYLVDRFFAVGLDDALVERLAGFFEAQLGTADVQSAGTYMEEPLRLLLHVILSRPEYQLG